MSNRSRAGRITTNSYELSASFPTTSINFPVIIRYLVEVIPASSKIFRAIFECSRSESIVVRTPSIGIPCKSHNPPTPEPVPISTTDLEFINLVANFRKFPTPALGSGAAISRPLDLACCIK